jgi:transposase-like protein
MYSYEERLRAVKLYIKLGKRAQATIRELGYPTKNALKGWHREYQRLNIIRRMALREKLSTREIARRTGMSRNTITKYLNAGTIEPQFTTPERQSKLDPFADKLTGGAEDRGRQVAQAAAHADAIVCRSDGSRI